LVPQTLWARDILPGPVFGDVVRVIDGDTVDVNLQVWLGQYIQTRVRLSKIDTPEIRGRCPAEIAKALQAKTVLEQVVKSGKVRLTNIQYGKYGGRIVAHLETDQGVNPGVLLIEKGLARPYDGKKRPVWCP